MRYNDVKGITMKMKSPIYDSIMSDLDNDLNSGQSLKLFKNAQANIKADGLKLKTANEPTQDNTELPTESSVESSVESSDSLKSFNSTYRKKNNTYSKEKRDTPGCADCSTYTRDYYKAQGKDIGGWTGSQWSNTKATSTPKKGDLVFFDTAGKGMNHVGTYNGDGTFNHMSTSGFKENQSLRNYGSKHKFMGFRTL